MMISMSAQELSARILKILRKKKHNGCIFDHNAMQTRNKGSHILSAKNIVYEQDLKSLLFLFTFFLVRPFGTP